jgi:hypothetical protein
MLLGLSDDMRFAHGWHSKTEIPNRHEKAIVGLDPKTQEQE